MQPTSPITTPPDAVTAADGWRGVGDLVALAVDRVAAPVEGMHDAIADRWFGLAGSRGVSARRLYHAFTAPVYGAVRAGGAVLGAAVGSATASAVRRQRLGQLHHSPLGATIQAAANATWGDELERRGSPLHIELGLRDAAGDPVDTDRTALAAAFPAARPRLVVLVPGLGETEDCWRRPPAAGEPSLQDLLAAASFTPIPVRYNSGRHVYENGADLAALLEEVVDGWPVPVSEIALVGHSMGGLVARSARHAAAAAGHRWLGAVRQVVTIGAPHHGAPLEKGANLASWGSKLAPESRPLGEFLDLRSAGIKDLRFGTILEDDWQGEDRDGLLAGRGGDPPPPDDVQHHFVAAAVTADPGHPLGVLVGDLIVRVGSGTGRGRRRRVEATHVRVLGGRRHFDLLADAVVHEQVRDWLAAPTEMSS